MQSVLAETGLPANRLELEVTESSLFSDRNNPIAILKKLRALGVRISIDDFGTGYSSLSRLSELNFDKIKIDKSFVNPISTQEDALNIVKLITGMAKSLNMGVIAEGVETEEQLERLQALGCELVQGYLFSKPQPQVDSKIKSGQNDPSPQPDTNRDHIFTHRYSLTITRCYHSPRKYLSTQSEALMLENVIIR